MAERRPVVDVGSGEFSVLSNEDTIDSTAINISALSGNALEVTLDGLFVQRGTVAPPQTRYMFVACMAPGATQELPFAAVQALNQFTVLPINTVGTLFANSRFTAPFGGVYEFNIRGYAVGNGVVEPSDWGATQLTVNDVVVAYENHFSAARTGDSHMQFKGGPWYVKLTPGDVVRPRLLNNACRSGMKLVSGGGTEFSGTLLARI